MSGGGKGGTGSKDYYGHMAWEFGVGPLDFTWGLIINNDLAWPKAKLWDSQIWKAKTLVSLAGNVYKALAKNSDDPPSSNWQLVADTWAAGTYATGTQKLYSGNVWVVTATPNTAAVPPATAPANAQGISQETAPWQYVGTPTPFSVGHKYWDAGSIVVWKGQIWTTAVGTKTEPGAPGSDWTLWRVNRADVANPYKFTVEGVGDFYLYWGTDAQTLDAVDEAVLTDFGHPAYRRKIVLVGKGIKFGTMQTTPPDPVLLGGRAPVQSLIVGASAALDSDWQANPWAILAELLTDPIIGLGLPNSAFDAASWQAQADFCAANPLLYYISPTFASFQRVRDLVSDLTSYPDGFVSLTAARLIAAGRWPHGEAGPAFDATNTVDRDCLVENLKWSSGLWADVATSVEVSFRDWNGGFKSRTVPAASAFASDVLRGVQVKGVDRPHIVREAQASAWANEFQKIYSMLKISGTNSVKQEKCLAVVPGSVFRITDDQAGVSLPQRCTRISIARPPTGTRQITYESERGVSPIPYSPTTAALPASGAIIPTAIKTAVFVQTPSQLGTGPHELTMLATRTNPSTSSADLWYRQKDGAAYQDLGRQTAFAVGGLFGFGINDTENTGTPGSTNVVVAAIGAVTQGNTYAIGDTDFWKHQVFYSANVGGLPASVAAEGADYLIDPDAGTITILTGGAIATGKYVFVHYWNTLVMQYDPNLVPAGDLDDVSVSLTQDEIADNEIILFACKASDPTQFEIMTVRSIQAVGLDPVIGFPMLFVKVFRAQYGTLLGGDGAYVWAADDLIFVVRRKHLQPFTHVDFASLEEAGSTANLIVTANSADVDGEVTDVQNDGSNPEGLATAWTYTFDDRYAPATTLQQIFRNGLNIGSLHWYVYNWIDTDKIKIALNVSSFNADLAHLTIVGMRGAEEVTLYSSNLQPNRSQNLVVQPIFPRLGDWRLRITALDLAGNSSSILSPDDDTVIFVNSVGTPTAESPVVRSAYSVKNGQISGLKFGLFQGNTHTLFWQLKPRGTAPDVQGAGGGVWNSIAAWNAQAVGFDSNAIPNFVAGQTLYAYCTNAGWANSETIHFNIDE